MQAMQKANVKGLIRSYARWSLKGTRVLEHAAGLRTSRRSHSQFGEDLIIQSYYDRLKYERNIALDPKQGVIVDIGCFRPIAFSNSYFFYKKGFSCINIDATPGSKAIFDRTRARDTNIEAAIGREDGTGTFYVFGAPSVWNTMDAEAAARATETTRITPKTHVVQIRRVETILDAHLKNRKLEMLLIDAEGFDLQVIQSNNFDKYRPRVVLFEVGSLSLSDLPSDPIVEHMQALEYSLYSWIAPNLMFVRNDSLV